MSTTGPAAPVGYLSEESKRRFTLAAGILGAGCFLAQTVLPMVVMFTLMFPFLLTQGFKDSRVDQSAFWRDELWVIEESSRFNLRDPERSSDVATLTRLRPQDLSPAGAPVPLGRTEAGADLTLLAVGDRLWVLGTDAVRYYEAGTVTRLEGPGKPRRTSKPFAYAGRPAFLSLGQATVLSTLHVVGGEGEWRRRELDLGLPPEAGALRALEALEVEGRLHLFAQLCSESPEQCSILHRELEGATWTRMVERSCLCEWGAVTVGARPAVAILERERERGRARGVAIAVLEPDGPGRHAIDFEKSEPSWFRWRAVSSGERLLLVSSGAANGFRLREMVGGRVVRSFRKPGAFPFGASMMILMVIPQLLPIALSLVLALVLTAQMRQHRVADYVHEGERRTFATLWQRALAQLVDALPVAVAFGVPAVGMWKLFSDPEAIAESGFLFPLWFFGGFLAAFLLGALVLVLYSYLEGRSGQTPGKWLLGIRVLGTDLKPCGFGRALMRNVLTLVDGFFNFLVGALMVAFTENWQRLGDFAARTIVVADRKA